MAGKATYKIAEEEHERSSLIVLRTKIYTQASKHVADCLMSDPFDDGAIQIGVWASGTPIASARVICLPPDSEWEHDRFVAWDASLFPPRTDCVEISRFCIERPHRNWHNIRHLCHGISDAMLRSKRRHFVACCTDELVDFYKVFFGAQMLGITINHSDLGSKPHHLFRCDYMSSLRGYGIHPLAWVVLWPTAFKNAISAHPEVLSSMPMARRLFLRFAVFIEPLAVSIFSYIRRRRRA